MNRSNPCARVDYCDVAFAKGKLLERFADFSHGFAVGHERGVGYDKDFHVHDRINLAFPRSSSIVEFTLKNPKKTFVLDDKSMLWMPAFVEHRQGARSMIYDTMAIFPDLKLVDKNFKLFRKRHGIKAALPTETIKKPRSVLLNELLNEYFAERVLERHDPNYLTSLSGQILDEVFRILVCPQRSLKIEQAGQTSELEGDLHVSRALRLIEGSLFDAHSIQSLAAKAGTSPATLFRKFRQELKITPGDYIVRRRLDESMSLLKRGDHTISDISLIVGYSDLAAFSKAFKKRFGSAPSKYLSNNSGTKPGYSAGSQTDYIDPIP